MTTGSICDDTDGMRSAGGAAEMAGSDGMAGRWTTSSVLRKAEGGKTGLGEGERDDGADMAGRLAVNRSGLREWRGLVCGAL